MIELYEFQAQAADQIADRVAAHVLDPLEIGRSSNRRRVPFIQFLSSITASGKTIILADAVASIAKQIPMQPVVLWLSKATVVVEQTYATLDGGGLLHPLISDFEIRLLADYDATEVSQTDAPYLFFATVGTFNQKDKEQGSRRVFRSAIDDAEHSTWEELKLRPDPEGNRRPLVIVYDEAHNLSDQQTDLLLELDPDAFVLSTATQRIPRRFNEEIIDVLRQSGDKSDEDLITQIDAKAVAETGLIKTTVELIGRQAPMEEVIDELFDELLAARTDADTYGLGGEPKVVYVCKTNVIEGSDEKDNHKQPFSQRQAPPILIWRYLTERRGVDPRTIAVYARLSVDKTFPLPEDFVLFKGGDRDYDDFVSGDFNHIIFNQSLQEGWDDPLVYFAYIDKSMGSRVQAEQIVGRLLRQPGRRSFPAERLNRAQISVRVESTGVFEDVVASVQKKIESEQLDVKLIKSGPGSKTRLEYPAHGQHSVPVAAIITDAAEEPIQRRLDTMTDYRNDDGTNTSGTGRTSRVQKIIGEPGNETFVWEDVGTSAFVLARWLFTREVRKIYQNALGLALTSSPDGSPTKFDARIGMGSNASVHIAAVAREVAEAFVENVYLKLRKPNPYVVGAILQEAEGLASFDNAVHDGYTRLNGTERIFADALDRTGLTWCRNPSRVGYGIPLIEPGRTQNFYPDFLVWSSNDVFAIDTKAAFLHADAMRKLVQIRPAGVSTPRLFVRFVSPGLVDEAGGKKDGDGYTVWSFKPNGQRAFTHLDSINRALARCLKPDV